MCGRYQVNVSDWLVDLCEDSFVVYYYPGDLTLLANGNIRGSSD